jgi:hypothetical protein
MADTFIGRIGILIPQGATLVSYQIHTERKLVHSHYGKALPNGSICQTLEVHDIVHCYLNYSLPQLDGTAKYFSRVAQLGPTNTIDQKEMNDLIDNFRYTAPRVTPNPENKCNSASPESK